MNETRGRLAANLLQIVALVLVPVGLFLMFGLGPALLATAPVFWLLGMALDPDRKGGDRE